MQKIRTLAPARSKASLYSQITTQVSVIYYIGKSYNAVSVYCLLILDYIQIFKIYRKKYPQKADNQPCFLTLFRQE